MNMKHNDVRGIMLSTDNTPCIHGLYNRRRSILFASTKLHHLLILLLFFLAMTASEGSKYAKICELRSSPPVTLQYDAATGQYSLVDNDDDEGDDDVFDRGARRELAGGEGGRMPVQIGKHHITGAAEGGRRSFPRVRGNRHNENADAHTATNSRLLQDHSNPNAAATASGSNSTTASKRTYIARSCPCDNAGTTYCLLDGFSPNTAVPDSCGVPWSDNLFATNNQDSGAISSTNFTAYNTLDIGCFELNSQTVFIRNAWPVVVLWYGALFIFLIATSNGKYARTYLTNLICPKFRSNDRTVDRIMERENGIRRRLRTAAVRSNPNLARYIVRTPGVRLPTRGAYWRRDGMTENEQQQEATRWWIEQAEHLGILTINDNGEEAVPGSPTGSVVSRPPQRMEYVMRTKTFNAEKEKARREEFRRMNCNGKAREAESLEDGASAADSKPPIIEPETDDVEEEKEEVEEKEVEVEENGSSIPETVATTLSSDKPIPAELDDTEEDGVPEQNIRPNDDEEEETFECTICLTEVEEGDRVGVLSCTHVFHADCLQQWITRRNACPLCQVTEVAAPRPVEFEADEVLSSILSTSSEGLLSNDEEAGGNTGNSNNSNRNTNPGSLAQNTTSFFMPRFFFPTSNNNSNNDSTEAQTQQQPQRTSSTPARMVLSPSSSSSNHGRSRDLSPLSMDDNTDHNHRRRRSSTATNRGNGGQRPQRSRRRRERRNQDLW